MSKQIGTEIYENTSRGVIHCHTDNSLKDSGIKIPDLVKRAIELQAPALTLTDHGTMMGIDEFMAQCKIQGIQGIPGVEVYYQEDDMRKREHMILLAKDYQGYIAIGKIVTLSNERIDSKGFPRVNKKILEDVFAELGAGHIIATSACVGGILAVPLLEAEELEEEYEKLEKESKGLLNHDSPSYKRNKELLNELNSMSVSISSRRKELQTLMKKPFKKKENAVEAAKKAGDMELYQERLDALNKEKEEVKLAEKELREINKKNPMITAKKKAVKQQLEIAESEHVKWKIIKEKQKRIKEQMLTEEESLSKTKEKALYFQKLFGKGNFFIEIQYHGIEAEYKAMKILALIGRELGIPLVAANDVHILRNTEEELLQRQLMRSLRYNKWEERNVGDDQLYMKTDEELASAIYSVLTPEQVKEAMDNISVIVNACNVEFPNEDHYPQFISEKEGESAEEAIVRKCREAIPKFFTKEEWTEQREARLNYELKTINEMGYANYHLIVQDFLEIGRKLGKLSKKNLDYLTEHINQMNLKELMEFVETHMTELALSIGPGRGSAAGSLACYLLGITSVDPMKFDLLFERFLNVERISMPDIDSDIASRVRDLLIEYVKKKYGEDAVCCILTKGAQQPKAAIRNAARLLGSEMHNDTSVYLDLGDQIAKAVPGTIGITFKSKVSDTSEQTCYEMLCEKYEENKTALKILYYATLLEQRLQNTGMHAAGVIISDGKPVSNYVPLLYNTQKERWVSQCDMVQAEEKGLLKMDFLGLKNLDIITDAIRYIKKERGIEIDPLKIPFNDKKTFELMSAGLTNGVFQFESPGMKEMLKQFRPDTIEDLILLVAAYRPGPMQYLNKIIRVKQGKEKIKYLTPELKPILDKTYGSIIYQEQVMRIFQDLAGYSLGQADLVRRAMSKKKMKVLEKERDAFIKGDKERHIDGCVKRGISAEKANQLFDEMIEFAKYAFNKSHAAAYAIVAYITGYLKSHYPCEYLCAVMNWSTIKKIPGLMSDCKKFKVDVQPPNINESVEEFSIHNNIILFGLKGIKNVGNGSALIIEERKRRGRFTSLKDFIQRTHSKKDVTESLIESGAFDIFGKNRYAMTKVIEDLNKQSKKIEEKTLLYQELKKEVMELDAGTTKKKYSAKEEKSLRTKLKNAQKAKEVAEETFVSIQVPMLMENQKERLRKEKELLGVYVSAHPLDEYTTPEELKCTPIEDLTVGKKKHIFGIITNLNIRKRKSDKAPMAFFELEDQTGSVNVACFTKAYAAYGEYIHEDEVVKINGSCFEEESFREDSDETILKFNVDSIENVKPIEKVVSIRVEDMADWTENIYPKIKRFIVPEGLLVIVYDALLGEYRKTGIYVSTALLTNHIGIEAKMI